MHKIIVNCVRAFADMATWLAKVSAWAARLDRLTLKAFYASFHTLGNTTGRGGGCLITYY